MNVIRHFISAFIILSTANIAYCRQYWTVDSASTSVTWETGKTGAHDDHIEMSGKRVSTVLRYGVKDDGTFHISKSMIWPMLRTIPNNTHASLMRRFDWNAIQDMKIDGRSVSERVLSVTIDGTLTASSLLNNGQVALVRTYFPSTENPSLIETYRFTNISDKPVGIELPSTNSVLTTAPGTAGNYRIEMRTGNGGMFTLQPGESHTYTASISAYKPDEQSISTDAQTEAAARIALVGELTGNLVLETPCPELDRMFALSKIRACESIYQTKNGPMHGPGGESYYAAIWANDQAEYINSYFPFTGYVYGNESAANSFSLFAGYINDEWKPIPSSIIAEGTDIWNGAGDRGDAAMIAYGAARFALASGDRQEAEKLWKLIEWCLEYNRRKLNNHGVVMSDHDELEGRFPAGSANLCTSSLYYDALLSSAYLAESLGKPRTLAKTYRRQAAALKDSIESYFAGPVEGFDTYRYYDGNTILRSWICIPLTMGIYDRRDATLDALFSPQLWTENGILSASGDKTYWDRATLYALRGAYQAGDADRATDYLLKYTAKRLLGEHVPYAVEAWPEGGQRHLSAESALYGRIVTEGLFGIRPTGLRSFTLTPQLPTGWNTMALRRIRAFGSDFDICVSRVSQHTIKVSVTLAGTSKPLTEKTIRTGGSIVIRLPE